MTIIPASLGEAWLVKKYVLRANQSPNVAPRRHEGRFILSKNGVQSLCEASLWDLTLGIQNLEILDSSIFLEAHNVQNS